MMKSEYQEEHGTGTNKFLTDTRFWDCECDEYYIHVKLGAGVCGTCGTKGKDQPDSRTSEIREGGHWANNLAWEFATITEEYKGAPYFPEL